VKMGALALVGGAGTNPCTTGMGAGAAEAGGGAGAPGAPGAAVGGRLIRAPMRLNGLDPSSARAGAAARQATSAATVTHAVTAAPSAGSRSAGSPPRRARPV
jgi:hypothetical protein